MAPMAKRLGRGIKKAGGGGLAALAEPFDSDQVIVLPMDPAEPDPNQNIQIDPNSGTIIIEHEDGSITIDPTGASLRAEPDRDPSHDENLAEIIDPAEAGRIVEMVMQKIDDAKQDRTQWVSMRAKILELLGIKLEDPKGDVSRSALGMATSSVRDPTMLQAVNMFRANTYGELCPSTGPVKVKIASPTESKTSQENA